MMKNGTPRLPCQTSTLATGTGGRTSPAELLETTTSASPDLTRAPSRDLISWLILTSSPLSRGGGRRDWRLLSSAQERTTPWAGLVPLDRSESARRLDEGVGAWPPL